MRSSRFVLFLVLLIFAKPATAQQANPSAPQATVLLQRALAALTGGHPLTDVTLSGTAERIAGSDDESGTVVIKALAGAGTRVDLTLPSGPRTELRNTDSVSSVGSWSGPDGIAHSIPSHNLMTDGGLFPAFTLASFVASQNAVLLYVGPETKNGKAVFHISASLQFTEFPADLTPLMQHLTQTDIFLDANTYLPVAIAFNIHADDNARLDIPVEIDFSNYQTVSSVQVPFHVQKLINNTLALDFQFQNVIVNSGLTVSSFSS
ncbi:MAG: hypothetical protein WA736_16745 [Candidatus Acidiferrum sp.]